MYACMYVRMYVCTYVCMYACMHACMYVSLSLSFSPYVYVYIYIYRIRRDAFGRARGRASACVRRLQPTSARRKSIINQHRSKDLLVVCYYAKQTNQTISKQTQLCKD